MRFWLKEKKNTFFLAYWCFPFQINIKLSKVFWSKKEQDRALSTSQYRWVRFVLFSSQLNRKTHPEFKCIPRLLSLLHRLHYFIVSVTELLIFSPPVLAKGASCGWKNGSLFTPGGGSVGVFSDVSGWTRIHTGLPQMGLAVSPSWWAARHLARQPPRPPVHVL